MKIRDLVPRRGKKELEWVEDHPFYSLQQGINRMFDEFWRDFEMPTLWREVRPFSPCVDVSETDTAVQVTVELPGIDPKDVELSISEGSLTLKGEKKQENEIEKDNYYRLERNYGAFSRTVPLPANLIDEEKAEANFENGILKITLPKLPEIEMDVRKIPIKMI